MPQETAVSSCNGGNDSYNVGGYNGGDIYNVGSYKMVADSPLYKQLCWEVGVSHNYVYIISEGPLMHVVTCL